MHRSTLPCRHTVSTRKQHAKSKNTATRAGMLALGLALASGAKAQNSVQLYGLVDMAVAYSSADPGGAFAATNKARSSISMNGNNMSTSFFGISGIEELGNGYKALLKMEAFFRPDTGSAGRTVNDVFFGRESYVGLTGPWGEVKLGKPLTSMGLSTYFTSAYGFSPMFDPMFRQLYTGTFAGVNNTSYIGNALPLDAEWGNSISYTSPNFGPFSFGANVGFAELAGANRKIHVGANALYFGGPLTATIAYQRVALGGGNTRGGTWPTFYPTPNADFPNPNDGFKMGDLGAAPTLSYQTTYFAGMSYKFDFMSLYSQFAHVANEGGKSGSQHDTTVTLGTKIPAGSGYFTAAYGHTWQTSGFGLTDGGRDTVSVSYNYNLSKRSDLYAAYRFDKFSADGPGNFVQSTVPTHYVALGMRHRF